MFSPAPHLFLSFFSPPLDPTSDASEPTAALREVSKEKKETPALSDKHLDLEFDAPFDFLLEGCLRLREVKLLKGYSASRWEPEMLANI